MELEHINGMGLFVLVSPFSFLLSICLPLTTKSVDKRFFGHNYGSGAGVPFSTIKCIDFNDLKVEGKIHRRNQKIRFGMWSCWFPTYLPLPTDLSPIDGIGFPLLESDHCLAPE